MFERFTKYARRAVVLAQDAAREMGHSQIRPEHLLVGLRQSQGLAAEAMTEAGVDEVALRARVASLYENQRSATNIDKVPFSSEGKKCLEQSLRAALELGHNYIGTEHIFFGVQRHAEANDRLLDDVLGVSGVLLSRQITERLSGIIDRRADASSSNAMRSPALRSAIERAGLRAGQSPMTTGQVLEAILADPESQVSRAFSELGVDSQRVQEALDAVDLTQTSDTDATTRSLTVSIGETTVLFYADAASALQELGAEQLRTIILGAIDRDPGRAAAG